MKKEERRNGRWRKKHRRGSSGGGRRGRIDGEEVVAAKKQWRAVKKQRRAARKDRWRRSSGGEDGLGSLGCWRRKRWHSFWVTEEGRDGIQMNPIYFCGIRLSHQRGIHFTVGINLSHPICVAKHRNRTKNNPILSDSQLPNGPVKQLCHGIEVVVFLYSPYFCHKCSKDLPEVANEFVYL